MAILGSTYNGEFEDVRGLDKVVEEVNKKNDWQVGIHVDGASGAFLAPFVYGSSLIRSAMGGSWRLNRTRASSVLVRSCDKALTLNAKFAARTCNN